PAIFRQKMVSKLLRTMGSRGSYFFYSQDRLKAIADDVGTRCSAGASLDFFHGFTPWILTTPPRPYVAWSDCTFHDYIRIYHRPELFHPEDLQRIQQTEAQWLRNARYVAFSSDWAASRAREFYGLNASCVRTVGALGEIDIPT